MLTNEETQTAAEPEVPAAEESQQLRGASHPEINTRQEERRCNYMDYEEGPLMASQRMKPMMCMDQASLPEIKDAKVGDKMTLTVVVEVIELRKKWFDTADKNNQVHAELQIDSVKKGGE